ncbi:branched-chain amino acid ABC transporter permease [Fischerella thermalis CCMEE 5198]|uniref:ABC transporter permease subunit n=1 Tax=Fischerella thermalis TaxID=372787 RepID=UPI000C80D064|nr:branched-chain amino acid ABC transporter permease [Fischerella thermalis]PLZ93699.1 branched-chain amino acid ABC transporter permease [Fischerella thermalis CCMEE 5196]PMB23558.1 branched-chain amino acid ABC transporter permease [Fischerella thermalis CCMEE 5198]
MLAGFLDAIFNGISIGAVLLIAALGLAIVFGLMGVINMAHGELMMLGAYTTFVVQNVSKQIGGLWFESYIFFALTFAFLITAIVGLFLEQGVVRYLYNRPLETLLATWGVSLILQQFVRSVNWVLVIAIALFCLLFFGGLLILNSRANFGRVRNWIVTVILLLSLGVTITVSNFLSATYQLAVTQPWFGAQNVDVTAPGWLRGGMSLGGVQLPFARLFIIALTVICVVGIYLFLQRSNWGLRIRAVTQNRNMSACLGIPTQKVDAMTFALGSGLAGVAGCAISLLGSVGPNTGQNYIIDTFMVVVVGGVGNLVGSIVAALAIGTVNFLIGSGTLALLLTPIQPLADLFTFFATTSMARVMVFALIIAFLQWKPAGIFPQKGRTVDV